jgi:hypothetical protein
MLLKQIVLDMKVETLFYGSIGNMIVLTRDEVDGMTGNIYDEEN